MLRSSSMREAAENSRLRKRHRPAPKEKELPTRKLREKLHVVSMRDGDLKMYGVRSNNNEGMAFSVHWKGGNDAKKWETVSGDKGERTPWPNQPLISQGKTTMTHQSQGKSFRRCSKCSLIQADSGAPPSVTCRPLLTSSGTCQVS